MSFCLRFPSSPLYCQSHSPPLLSPLRFNPNIKFLPFAVAEKLKQEGRQEMSSTETTEELEDDDGNVYNRKTYEDLKKQGII